MAAPTLLSVSLSQCVYVLTYGTIVMPTLRNDVRGCVGSPTAFSN